jgi:hypothetical protein
MPYRAPNQRAVTPQGRGRFPGFDVLEEVHRWDDVTAGVVLARLAPTTDLSFFTLAENGTATALTDLLFAQDGDPRVPVVAMIDARLAAGETDGWHYDDMPTDAEAWRRTLAALDSHPWAWNEMGQPGPAYPRGYKNLGIDAREPFEVTDAVGTDPVAFGARVERARAEQAGQLAGQRLEGES